MDNPGNWKNRKRERREYDHDNDDQQEDRDFLPDYSDYSDYRSATKKPDVQTPQDRQQMDQYIRADSVLPLWNQSLNKRAFPASPELSETADDYSFERKRLSPEIENPQNQQMQNQQFDQQKYDYNRRMQTMYVGEKLNNIGCMNKDNQQRFFDPISNNTLTRIDTVFSLDGMAQNGNRVRACFDILSLGKHVIKIAEQYNLGSPENKPDNDPYLHFNAKGFVFNVTVGAMKNIVEHYLKAVGAR